MKSVVRPEYIKEIIQLYALYILLVLVIYKAPQIVSLLVQIAMLIAFYRSKKDYFWFALVFIAESQPGSFFMLSDPSHSFSLFQFGPVGYLYFWMLFIVVAFFKTLKKKSTYPFFLQGPVIALLIYIIFLLLIYGIHKLSYFKFFLPWLFLFILPRSFKKEEDYIGFFNLLFAFVFFVVLTQIYFLLVGHDINVMLGGRLYSVLPDKTIEEASQALRPVAGISITFFSIIGSVILLLYKKTNISKNYLFTILIVSLFSIFLTATRSWMIAAILIFISFLLFNSKNPFSLILKFLLPIVVLILLFSFVPLLKKQSDMAVDRFETLINLTEGDVTAGGTLSRIDERGPRVMKKFWESPIIGFGLGDESMVADDGHVGFQNMLLHSGIIGLILYIILWLSFSFKMFFRENSLSGKHNYKHIPIILITSLLGLIVIHAGSQWFGLGFSYDRGFIFFLILTYGNFIYWESAKKESLIK